MPSGRIDQTLYMGPYKSVEAINVTTLYKPGELGSQIQLGPKAYQLVQVDSGAVAATGAGHAPQCGDLAYWKDRSKYLVTNDKVQAETGNQSGACGVFCSLTQGAAGTASITPGNYGVIQQRGTHVGVLTVSTAAAKNDLLAAAATASSATPAVIKFSTGTAPTTFPQIGVATAATGAVTANYTPAYLGGGDLVDVG